MNRPIQEKVCGLNKTEIVLTEPFSSSSNQNYVGTKFLCLKYDIQCTYTEPDDKTCNTTVYGQPAKTQVSLCMDPQYKASFFDSPEIAGLVKAEQTTDVQAQRVQYGPSLCTSFIVGFAMHRLVCDLFVQT